MQDYIVIEIQTNDQDITSTIVETEADYWVAQQKYHRILSYAAVSGLPIHSAVILSPYGDTIEKKSYNRRTGGGDEE